MPNDTEKEEASLNRLDYLIKCLKAESRRHGALEVITEYTINKVIYSAYADYDGGAR